MNISKYSEYVTYKEIVDSIDVIISKDKKLNNLDGYLYYEIEKLDKQTSMSMEKFVSIINNKLSKDIILSRYLNNVCSIEEIKKIAQSEIFTKIAIFSIENSIILRK